MPKAWPLQSHESEVRPVEHVSAGRVGALVALADLLHGEQDDEPHGAHDKFSPLEVGRPGGAQQVLLHT